MKILGGVVAPSDGAIRIDGVEHAALTVGGAMAAGIAFVHQELNLFDNLDVAANVFIGREPRRRRAAAAGRPRRRCAASVTPLLRPARRRLRARHAGRRPVAGAAAAGRDRQGAVARRAPRHHGRADLEPDRSPRPTRLLEVIAELKADGVGVIFISHRLNEVEHCADRVVVLRDGRCRRRARRGARSSHDAMIRLMIGRDLKVALRRRPTRRPASAVLEIAGVRTAALSRRTRSTSPSARGEILGLAGWSAPAAPSWRAPSSASTGRSAATSRLDGEPVADPHAARRDRRAASSSCRRTASASGLLLDFPIAENISLANLAAFARGTWSSARRRARATRPSSSAELDIRTPRIDTLVGTLSGGNQQKVVLAKWLSMTPERRSSSTSRRAASTSARRREIYRLMRGLADAGVAVLMISSDMEEVIGVSDRVAVMHEGRDRGLPRARRVQRGERAAAGGRPATTCSEAEAVTMLKKDLGLFLLILVVGVVVAIINPRFLSPINLANTANLVGLFGLFSHRRRASSSSPAASSCRSAR